MMKARKRIFVGPVAMVRFFLAILVALSFSIQAEELVDATAQYDPDNIFARILRGDAPADVVFENDYALAFHDIRPRAKVHVLVIPKGPYTNVMQFNARASDEEKLGLLDAISQTAQIMKVDETGFRLISNTGGHGKQTVPHLHVHILGGEPVHIGTR
jgi:diadenosine tetraphosphate (Ap4A) HIT family hydrolase